MSSRTAETVRVRTLEPVRPVTQAPHPALYEVFFVKRKICVVSGPGRRVGGPLEARSCQSKPWRRQMSLARRLSRPKPPEAVAEGQPLHGDGARLTIVIGSSGRPIPEIHRQKTTDSDRHPQPSLRLAVGVWSAQGSPHSAPGNPPCRSNTTPSVAITFRSVAIGSRTGENTMRHCDGVVV